MCTFIEETKNKIWISLDEKPEICHNKIKTEQRSNEYEKKLNISDWIYFCCLQDYIEDWAEKTNA